MPNDLFISYAHIDNQPFGDTQGWVDQLLDRLRVRLAMVLGSEPVIWWDQRLQGDQYFAGEIGDRLSETLLLAPVVTPRYVKSEWCRGELNEFCQRAQLNPQMGNHSLIFKIVKTPVSDEQMPNELRPLLGYVFYDFDEKNRPREFRSEIAPNKDQRYWDKLEDLVWDIRNAIEQLRPQPNAVLDGSPASFAAMPLEKKVYLAETIPELNVERDRIKRELQQHGYYVLPDGPLPSNRRDLEDAVREYLARCVLSIHILGASFEEPVATGDSHGNSALPVVPLQVKLAGERVNSGERFSCLLWLPPDLQIEDPRQQHFIDELQDEIGAGTELLQTSLEDLKLRINEKLTQESQVFRKAPEASAQRSSVYLIYDNRDANDTKPIEDFIYNQGFEVIPPIFEGDGAEVAQYHRESLLNCDGALIYYGSANQMWLRSKIWDLQKALGWGRQFPVMAAVYVGGPPTDEKEDFHTHEVPFVIRNFSEFSSADLQPFLDAMQTGNGGTIQ
jgi:hypothetical protein